METKNLIIENNGKRCRIKIYQNEKDGNFRVAGIDNSMLLIIDKLVSAEFRIDNLKSRCRAGNYPLARDAFARLASDHRYTVTEIAAYLKLNKRTVYEQLASADMMLIHNREFKRMFSKVQKILKSDFSTDTITDINGPTDTITDINRESF